MRSKRGFAEFGTILGQHTVSELQDLVKAKDADISQIAAAYKAYQPTWKTVDAAGHSAFESDWNDMIDKYNSARAKAESAIDIAKFKLIGPDLIPAESEWIGLLRSLNRVEGIVTKGDFQDLYSRLHEASGVKPYENVPQPTAYDGDLEAYKEVDSIIKSGEDNAKKKAEELISSRWVWIGGLVGASALALYLKALIPMPHHRREE